MEDESETVVGTEPVNFETEMSADVEQGKSKPEASVSGGYKPEVPVGDRGQIAQNKPGTKPAEAISNNPLAADTESTANQTSDNKGTQGQSAPVLQESAEEPEYTVPTVTTVLDIYKRVNGERKLGIP